MNKIELEIISLSHSITQTHSYAVVLGEVFGKRRVPIVIGGFEAQAIAVALERMQPSRPLTHDLMCNMLQALGVHLLEIVIYRLEEGVFFSKLICQQGSETVEIDCRTSDALAIAVRAECPIYTYEQIMQHAAVSLDEENESAISDTPRTMVPPAQDENNLSALSLEALQQKLAEVLEFEDYIQAAAIRDEINKRNKS